ncbi:hypothetical protein QQ045_018766 [Rhodiola kirilowii]
MSIANARLGQDFQKRKHSYKKKLFRFEPMWLRHEEFGDFVRSRWSEGGNRQRLMGKLTGLRHGLEGWNSTVFGKVQKQISELKKGARGEI